MKGVSKMKAPEGCPECGSKGTMFLRVIEHYPIPLKIVRRGAEAALAFSRRTVPGQIDIVVDCSECGFETLWQQDVGGDE
jgi:hypothetical protein